MSTSLSGVITEFGGTGTTPNNLRGYLKMGGFAGWYGGVAEHANNSAIPVSGNLSLTNFDSPADKNFVSDTYVADTSSYFDPGPPLTQTFTGYGLNLAVMTGSGLDFLDPTGTVGSRTVVGKSTYGSTGQTATVAMIGDFDNNGSTGFIIGFTGDQRASGWGGAGNVQAPVSVIINSNTFTIASSSDPAGYFNNGYTYWSWTSQAGLSNGNFTFQVSIY